MVSRIRVLAWSFVEFRGDVVEVVLADGAQVGAFEEVLTQRVVAGRAVTAVACAPQAVTGVAWEEGRRPPGCALSVAPATCITCHSQKGNRAGATRSR